MKVGRLLTLGVTLLSGPRTAICQSLIDQDISYGLRIHNQISSSNSTITTGPMHDKLEVIFKNLNQTALVQQGPSLPYSLTYLNSPLVNASSAAGGRLYVYDGLTRLTNGDSGMIAFALGHEMAHSMGQHSIKHYLREVQHQAMLAWYRNRIAYGDRRASTELLAYATAHSLIEKKVERNDENNADRVGLLIAAQAGYHPDFAIQLTRVMRADHADRSKFVTFFMSDHPRWATREDKIEKNYEQAMATFNTRWPTVAQSPGGVPPQITAHTVKGQNDIAAPHTVVPAQTDSALSPNDVSANNLIDITLVSTPPNALVSMYGMAIGRTPFTTKLAPGSYKTTFSSSGYSDSTLEITVGPGHPTTVSASFKASAVPSVNPPAMENVSVTLPPATPAPPMPNAIPMHVTETTRLAVTPPVRQPEQTHSSVQASPIVPAPAQRTKTEVPTPLTAVATDKAELTIISSPSHAAVEINGVVVGGTPLTVSLVKGTNCTISVKKDGFMPWVTHYSAVVAGTFSMNTNLTREVLR